MSRGLTLLAILLVVAVGSASAIDTAHKPLEQANIKNLTDKVINDNPAFTRDDPDTVFFGGDDGTGNPVVDGVWDFDTIVSDPFQGWTSVDRTANLADYFYRVTATDFADHNDPCTPMILGTTGQLWCGIHEDEANQRDFLAGMGYQNNMCQSAFSPVITADPLTNDIVIDFTYFNDTEIAFDYTYLYVSCFDSGDELVTDGWVELTYFDGIIGSYTAPEQYQHTISAGILPVGTAKIQVELRMWADGGYSDEDGSWDTPCGPFAVDDLSITIGTGTPTTYDWDADEQGWTFSRCPGIGAFMAICPEETWLPWLEEAGLTCDCSLSGNALDFNDHLSSPFDPPGHPSGQEEEAVSPIVSRAGYDPAVYNSALMYWTDYLYLPQDRGSFYRMGYKMYPYVTEVNPTPHWSTRRGQNTWFYVGVDAVCSDNAYSLSTIGGSAGDPLPNSWTELRIVYETNTSCDSFGLPESDDEGNNRGAPVVDNLRAGITGMADAPVISYEFNGASFQDGYGQNFPTYLEPSDVGNSNVVLDKSGIEDHTENDWNGDSSQVAGPTVVNSDPLTQWDCRLYFKLTHIGPRQQLNPDYLAWKARLVSDPEVDFCCVIMDSVETTQGAFANKYKSYAREDDPYYDAGSGEFSEANEILPDGVFTPGTRIEYYYASVWTHIPGAPEFVYPPFHAEFEILPRMRLAERGDYTVEWPCCLYVDAFNRGVEYYVAPTFTDLLQIEYDKYDYLDASSNWKTPMHRSFCGTGPYNPGGWGNNGLSVEQLLGYRLIFLNTGSFGSGGMESSDFTMFQQWLSSTDCEMPTVRRGIIFDGDGIADIMMSPNFEGNEGADLLHNFLGANLIATSYRDHVNDHENCIALGAGATPEFEMADDTNLFGNGCPSEFNYNVLGVQGGIAGAMGNMIFDNGITMDPGDYIQVVRDNTSYPYNWRSVVNGFSIHHLSFDGCGVGDCSGDSSCVVEGAANILLPTINWIQSGADAFDPWLYPCTMTGVDEDPENHSSLKINFLRGATPNPFRSSATIRFSLADAGNVDFSIYDVSGRLVKAMGENAFEAGENSVVWDGTNTNGNRVGGGIYWMQMNTDDGFSSGKKMIVLK